MKYGLRAIPNIGNLTAESVEMAIRSTLAGFGIDVPEDLFSASHFKRSAAMDKLYKAIVAGQKKRWSLEALRKNREMAVEAMTCINSLLHAFFRNANENQKERRDRRRESSRRSSSRSQA